MTGSSNPALQWVARATHLCLVPRYGQKMKRVSLRVPFAGPLLGQPQHTGQGRRRGATASVFPARSVRRHEYGEEKGAQLTQSQLQEPKATPGHDVTMLACPGAVSIADPLVGGGPDSPWFCAPPHQGEGVEERWWPRGRLGLFLSFLSRRVIPTPWLCGLPKCHCPILGLSPFYLLLPDCGWLQLRPFFTWGVQQP